MTERSEIVRVLEQAYAARKQGHMDSILAVLMMRMRLLERRARRLRRWGGPSKSPRSSNWFDAFELLDYKIHCMVIEGNRAAVHWHGKFRATATGKTAETDLLDLIEVRDGRITSFHNFFDTALAARLMTP